ncbi:MAG: ribonuclease D [Aliiglaciecola sp.]|uniref:ribonuclease D n=1 Tax=Aliiglaciecola sp. M165 TaxID=2593649 RepID=UPI00118158A6|nr:ribonuclease D [Aliiglaciecola sp. M165]TRY29266.1 ribonuclease D [Aliiglaciecola sp. M165]
MQYTLITSDQALASFCTKAQNAAAVAVDTEFVRTRTLYPKLGLIQLYDGEDLVLVDPLSIENFSPLVDLLTNPSVIKVLHSCSEDLETFWQSLAVIPAPIYDTQFAACLLNMGATLGYAALIDKMLEIKVDKGESRTDWIARPLTKQQLHYAANDVLYLHQVYSTLKKQTDELDRTEWIFHEMAQLAKKKTIAPPAELAYLGFKNNWKLEPKALYVLKLLAKWRLEQARARDLALNFVVRESNLVEIARLQPTHKGALFAIDGMSPQEARIHGEALLSIVEEAQHAPEEVYPQPIDRLMEQKGFKKVAAEIRAYCQQKAAELAIPVEVLGSKKQIQQLLKWHWKLQDELSAMGLMPDLIIGWRATVLQDGVEQILSRYPGN